MDSLISNDEVVVGRKGKLDIDTTECGGIEREFVTERSSGLIEGDVHAMEHFREKEYVISAIYESIDLFDNEGVSGASTLRKLLHGVIRTIDKYREEPELLDPHALEILKPVFDRDLSSVMKGERSWSLISSMLCSIVYSICSVCGFEALTKNEIFPHQVVFLEPVLAMLEEFPDDQWESRFVLLLWLSVLVMVPFDPSALGIDNLGERILSLAKRGLETSKRSSNKSIVKASSMCVARLFARSDATSRCMLESFIKHTPEPGSATVLAYLEALGRTLTVVPQSALSEGSLEHLIEWTGQLEPVSVRGRKLLISVWGSLAVLSRQNLDQVECLLERILRRIDDKDSSVRFCGAKNLARISASLPQYYADQIVDYVLSIDPFDEAETHSKCVILAELARRGQIRSSKSICATVTVAMQALEHERSSHSLTVQIRDAGCAIIWSLSRSTNPDFLLDHVLVPCFPSLVVAALFERDINLRRVAAASMQELIGRVGTSRFPVGLSILNTIDFWSVASAADCFRVLPSRLLSELAPRDPEWHNRILSRIVVHLQTEKLEKLALQIGTQATKNGINTIELAADALGRLSWIHHNSSDLVDRMATRAVMTEPNEWASRLGSIWCLKNILRHSGDALEERSQSLIRNLVPQIEKKRLYRGKGGDLIRIAAYDLVGEIFKASAKLRISFKDEAKFVHKICADSLTEGITHLNDEVQISAVRALRSVVTNSKISFKEIVQPVIVDQSLTRLQGKDVNICARRGLILALSTVVDYIDSVDLFDCLIDLFLLEINAWPLHHISQDMVDPVARKYAVLGLVRAGLGFDNPCAAKKIVDGLLHAIEDFQTDKRGDVGSWVRLTAIQGIAIMLRFEADEQNRDRMIQAIVTHSGARLDRVREAAVNALVSLNVKSWNIDVALSELFTTATGSAEPMVGLRVNRSSVDLGSDFSIFKICPFRGLCDVISRSPLEECHYYLSQYVQCTGGATAQPITRAAENALCDISKICGGKLFDSLMTLLRCNERFRFASNQDQISRIFIPTLSTISMLLARGVLDVSSEQIQTLHTETIAPAIANVHCPTILGVNRVRAVCGLYSRFAHADSELFKFIIQHGLLSRVPVLRYSVAMDLLTSTTCLADAVDDMIEVLDSTNWLAEDVSEWMPSVEKLATQAGIFDVSNMHVSPTLNEEAKPRRPAYADFVNEVHRFR